MMRSRVVGMGLAWLLVLAAAGGAWAGAPTDQLRGAIDRVIKALDNPALKGDSKVGERRTAVRKIANDIFDFGEIARRSLGRHWQGRTDKEREEFISLFGDLLERSYISKIELYGGEKILYTNERMDAEVAVVSTKIITKNGTEVPIDYRLLRRGDRWLVYDISIEGVSLVSNYRTQFNKIIQTTSYGELVKKMRAKQDEVSFEDEAQKKGKTSKTQ
ncbi:MAG: ABC transporter substrate-binding protein [Candidatus Rokubacteria bacterium]|nr:ABC transporter substrate-binding protein [Candidatus Rokubacteria bacterium]MBI2198960.1 ABC transporter substrate-binding protein [Candidatus Rokubacteria bacterium]